MSLKWNANENPVGSTKLNKMSVRHLTTTERNALVSADVDIGDIIFDRTENKHYRVDTVSPSITFKVLGGGGGSVEYPYSQSYKETIDHFTDTNFPTYLGASCYQVLGAGSLLSINQSSNDEFDNHSVWASQILNTVERGNWADRHAVYHTKRDIDNSFTKVNIEFRSKYRTRIASLEHWLGLGDGTAFGNISTATIRKITVYENNGNYQLRTSDGATQSDLDTNTVGDTSAHRFKMVWSNVPNVEILIDGVSKGTKTTNLPDNALNPVMAMKNASGADQNGDIHDYWHVKME